MSFNLQTGQWYVATPTEARPILNRVKRGERLNLIVFEDAHSPYLKVSLAPSSDMEVGQKFYIGDAERWTPDEYNSTQPLIESTPPVDDDDLIVTGSGFMMAMEMSPPPSAYLNPGERGLILQSGISEMKGELMVRTGFEPEELRALLLFWDRLDWPDHNQVTSVVDAEIDFLKSEGVLRRSEFGTLGPMLSKKRLKSLHLAAFDNNQKIEPGRWACARGSHHDYRPNRDHEVSDIVVNLIDAIIVPDANVPLEDVLDFKDRRRDELIALRHHLEELAEGVLAAQDLQSAWNRSMEKVAIAAKVQSRVANERGWTKFLPKWGLELSTDLTKIASAAVVGAFIGDPVSTVLGAVTPQVKTALVGRDKDNSGDPYRYVFSINQEIGIRK